ncbi:MFS transporter [Stagnimonas aquatica]|uniref:MFS transporter n=1 Tax=Stagnimonas aquatica TaxID=2689987 RepID=A0A3N0V813_9GAMM|nr:MFS transporter [Stagnimonas aquatica]ROH88724.1 MFS transporter [Stagnimonas aquatica]
MTATTAAGTETAAPALGPWRKLGYAAGAAGIGVAGVPSSLLLLFYLTEIVRVPPATAGLLIGLTKIWDVLVDPALGGAVERYSRRRGARAPLAFVSALAYVLALLGLFALPAQAGPLGSLLLVVTLLIVSSVAHTAFLVLKLALADDMTRGAAQRMGLFAYSGVLTALLTLAATAMVPFLIRWGGDGARGYALMACGIAVFGALSFLAFLLSTRHYPVRQDSGKAAEPALWQSIRLSFGNRPYYYLLGFLLCFGTSAGLLSAFLPYINQYLLRAGPGSLSVLGSITLLCMLLSMPLIALLVRRYGNLGTVRYANTVFLLSFPLLWLASYGPTWATWSAVAVFGLGAGGMAILLQSTIIDIAKLRLAGGVVVSMGVYLGIFMAAQKLGQSAGSVVAGLLLDWSGFVPGQAEQNARALEVLRLGYTLAPMGLTALGTLCVWRIRLSEGGAEED